ncbi:ectoine/hydroxyectoine ABC transporter substrate-binding protein EhuB, partial [Mesorhizobium sp. M0676]
RDKGVTAVTGSGWAAVKTAQKIGIPDDKLLQVAGGAAEVAQAVKSRRADAALGTGSFSFQVFVERDNLELADPFTPSVGMTGEAIAFLPDQQAEVDAFNTALKNYLGSDEMMKAVGKFDYTRANLPPKSLTTAGLCKG